MIRATTPTHTFSLPIETNTIKSLLVTYKQGEDIVLEKTKEDCTLTGSTIKLTLTQEETKMFSPERVKIQLRVLTNDNVSLASKVKTKTVEDVLNDVVLQ